MANTKKIIAWGLIGLTALAGGYFIIKGIKNGKLNSGKGQDDENAKSPQTIPPVVKGVNIYPLKRGSKGAKGTAVGEAIRLLQLNLGVGVDGDWGKETDTAFKAQTGKTQISNENELAEIISFINAAKQSQNVKNQKHSRSTELINLANKGGFSNIKMKETDSWRKVSRDSINGTYYNEGMIINAAKGQKFSLKDYKPTSALNNGDLIIECLTGGNKGLWEADPNKIDLI